jgi:hypothetical protein
MCGMRMSEIMASTASRSSAARACTPSVASITAKFSDSNTARNNFKLPGESSTIRTFIMVQVTKLPNCAGSVRVLMGLVIKAMQPAANSSAFG